MGPRARRITLVAATIMTVLSVVVLAWQRVAGPDVAAGRAATLSGLTIEVAAADWVEMGHLESSPGGFAMPGQMMPGAPQGDEVRLGISITLSNTATSSRGFNLVEEFALIGGSVKQPLGLSADTIGTLPRLGPGASVRGTLYFDLTVPTESDPPLYLMWVRDGDTVRLPVPLDGDTPGHGHG